MCLTREYYTLNYRNYNNVSEFQDHVKSLEKQIDATEVKITADKQTLLCLTMAFWNKSHYQSLVQIWGVTKDMTAEKAREMLLDDERRLNADSRASALVTRGHPNRNTAVGSCQYYEKPGHKGDSCWKKYPELISNQYTPEQKEPSPTSPKKALSIGKKRLC